MCSASKSSRTHSVVSPCGPPPALPHLEQCMVAIARIGPHFFWPAPGFDRARPLRADQNVRAVDLKNRAVDRSGMCHRLGVAAYAHCKRLAFEAGGGAHAWNG